MSAKTSSPVIKVPVRFQGVTHGVETVSIGIKFDTGEFDELSAIKALGKRRISVRLDRLTKDEDPDQTKLPDVEDVSVVGSADTARVSFGGGITAVRLTFNPAELEDQEIVLLHHQRGLMTIKNVGEIPIGNVTPEVDVDAA
jgi:hypothetical protein